MKIGVIGMGIMGSGIAEVTAIAKHEVYATEVSQQLYQKGIESISKSLDKLIEKKVVKEDKGTILSRIKYIDDYSEFRECDIIIEAIVENLNAKKELYKKLEPHLEKDTILGSNTSSISITSLASGLKNPEKFLGIHFFNPVPLMNLVEIIKGIRTEQYAIDKTIEYVKSINKEFVVVNDSPGFVTTRIIVTMVNEGAFILQEGLASKEDIDKALKLGGNFPMGPLTLGDLIGLDTVLNIMDTLYESFKDPKYRAAPILRKMVEAGKLGKKSGEGFYKY
ncbi:MAG: 3-hydroxyacyl-CoA dehydrogenase NAD-binding domain-containing protein [Thermoplasmatales archaeon]